MSRRLVDCLLILLNARAYLNIAIESRFAPMMLLAVFKKVQYKLLMHRLAQMNVRFALMNSKRCNKELNRGLNQQLKMGSLIKTCRDKTKENEMIFLKFKTEAAKFWFLKRRLDSVTIPSDEGNKQILYFFMIVYFLGS